MPESRSRMGGFPVSDIADFPVSVNLYFSSQRILDFFVPVIPAIKRGTQRYCEVVCNG
jgi:hypothetical protein